VNNAGALFLQRHESEDGIEMTLALNHLAYFQLTNLLLDRLTASAPARIINISSAGHRRAQMDFDDLQGRHHYHGLRAYYQSKLANVLFTYELARRLAGTGVTVNAVGPGYVATHFAFNNFGFIPEGLVNLWMRLYGLVGTNVEAGAQTAIDLATSAAVAGVTGRYFERQTAVPSSHASYNAVDAQRLWQISAELTGLTGA
jgi:NAD(P)-dependent dehydrogenase (short-subunit alcohol dehydrogenase family)